MNITTIGHVCIDNNISEHSSYRGAGGPAIFMQKILSQFPDVNLKIIAPYGIDFLPFIKKLPIYPQNKIQAKTLMYENITHGKHRTQRAFNRKCAKPVKIDDKIINIIKLSDIIIFAPLTPDYSPKYIQQALSYAKKGVLKIILAQGYYRNFKNINDVIHRDFIESEILLPMFNFVILSEHDDKNINSKIKQLSQKTKIILTLGDKGSLYIYRNNTISISTNPVSLNKIVDSVGSGDIFSASLAYKYFLTKNIRRSLKFANSIARQCLFHTSNDLRLNLAK